MYMHTVHIKRVVTETLGMTFFKTVVGELYEHTDEPTLTWLPSFRYGEDGVRVSFLSCTLTPTNDERTMGLEIHVHVHVDNRSYTYHILFACIYYSSTDYKIPKLTCIIYQNDPQLSLINLITINWHHVTVT